MCVCVCVLCVCGCGQVSLIDSSMMISLPLCYFGALQYLIVSSSLHLQHASPPITTIPSTPPNAASNSSSSAPATSPLVEQAARTARAEEALAYGLSVFVLTVFIIGAAAQVLYVARRYFDVKKVCSTAGSRMCFLLSTRSALSLSRSLLAPKSECVPLSSHLNLSLSHRGTWKFKRCATNGVRLTVCDCGNRKFNGP